MWHCCVMCLTETWLFHKVPDSAIQLPGFSVHCTDRSQALIGKSRGSGICFMLNNSLCDYANVHPYLKCRPFWLPRDFTAMIITAVYIPPQADTDRVLRELQRDQQSENRTPKGGFITTGPLLVRPIRVLAAGLF